MVFLLELLGACVIAYIIWRGVENWVNDLNKKAAENAKATTTKDTKDE